MSAVIFVKSSIEAAGTPATGVFYYRPFTISLFYLMGFSTGLSCYRPLTTSFSCYRPLTTSLFYRMGSAIGRFLLSAPYYKTFLSHGVCYRPLTIWALLPAFSAILALQLAFSIT